MGGLLPRAGGSCKYPESAEQGQTSKTRCLDTEVKYLAGAGSWLVEPAAAESWEVEGLEDAYVAKIARPWSFDAVNLPILGARLWPLLQDCNGVCSDMPRGAALQRVAALSLASYASSAERSDRQHHDHGWSPYTARDSCGGGTELRGRAGLQPEVSNARGRWCKLDERLPTHAASRLEQARRAVIGT